LHIVIAGLDRHPQELILVDILLWMRQNGRTD
jgi:hypothetical protein